MGRTERGGTERARQTSNGEAALGLGTRLASRCRASPDSLPPACSTGRFKGDGEGESFANRMLRVHI